MTISNDEFRDKVCYIGISSLPDVLGDAQYYLLGDTFLRHFYTIFNYDKTGEFPPSRKIGLALNSQYVNDGYDHVPVQLHLFGDVTGHVKHFYILQSLVIGITFFVYIGLHMLQKERLKKRMALRAIKEKAKDGFQGSSLLAK